MTTLFQHWDTWWHREAPPDILAILRIGFGAFLLVEAATYLPFVPTMFSSRGLVIPMHVADPERWPMLAAAFAPPPPVVAWIVAGLYCCAAALLAIGYRMRLAIAMLLVLYVYYWILSFHLFPSSYHRIFTFILIVLLFSGADKTFSLRMKRERGSWLAWEPISILPQRLLAVQITATYFIVGIQKWWLPLWQGGEVMYYSYIGRWGTPLARRFVGLGWPWEFYEFQTLSTKIFETLIPFGFWIPRVRWFFFLGGFAFHFLIAILLGIWWFLVLVPAYILFFEPEAVHAAIRRRLGR